MFDLLVKQVHVEDPVNGISGVRDIAIEDRRIANVCEEIASDSAKTVLDLEGNIAIPGIIDPHVHICGEFGNPTGFPMLVKAGVCTAFNLAGPVEAAWECIPYGCGLNLATLEDATPGRRIDSNHLKQSAVDAFIDTALEAGALGIKILGGHHPLTPETSERIIRSTFRSGGYASWHAGSTCSGSNIEGMREVMELVGDTHVHIAHINSYCRGQIYHELAEVMEALELLENHPSVLSESYIAAVNGTHLAIGDDGRLVSHSTRISFNCLGYSDDEKGVASAIKDGKAYVLVVRGGETISITGDEGVAAWHEAETHIAGSLNVNPPMGRIALAVARRSSGDFSVDALSTDGGSIPRNVLVSQGLALVAVGVLTMSEYVRKISYNASRMLSLRNKGHLGIGADADISVLNFANRKAVATIIGGEVCMVNGYVCGKGGTAIITERGSRAIKKRGLSYYCTDVSHGPLPFRQGL